MFTLLISLLFSLEARADWFCTEGASDRRGNSFYSCGVANAQTESEARDAALNNAQTEFTKLCSASSDCIGHSVSIDPKRNECVKEASGITCRRLVVFTIGEPQVAGSTQTSSVTTPKLKIGMHKKEFLKLFGNPVKVLQSWVAERRFMFKYAGPMCDSSDCFVTFQDDALINHHGINYNYTDALN